MSIAAGHEVIQSSRAPRQRTVWWPLVAAILLGTILRFYRLGANSLWIDEIATLWVAKHAPGEILRMSSSVNFIPPLYFLFIHGMLRLFGESEVTLRLLSVLAGIATIPVVWFLTEQLTESRRTANLTATLLAVNPLHLWYSQEARPYALLLFFGCSALLSLVRARKTGSMWYWIAFSAFSALAFLTHTTGVMFGLIAWIWVFWSADGRRHVRPLLASSVMAGVVCAPFIIAIALALLATHGTFHSPPRALTGLEIPYNLLTYVGGYSFGPSPREIQNTGASTALRAHVFESAVAGSLILAVLVALLLKRRAEMAPFLVLLGIPLVGIFILSALSGKAYNVRYTVPGLIGFLGVLSVAVSPLQARSRAAWLTAVIVLSLWADGQWYWVSNYWKEDSRAAVAWLHEALGSGASVAVAPPYSMANLSYYAEKAGVSIHFRPALDTAALHSPDALVLSRLHHVPNWQELRSVFLKSHTDVIKDQVAGYEMLVGNPAAQSEQAPSKP